MPFTVATWNINSVRLREELVERFLLSTQPDLLCLQEIKCTDEQFPAEKFRAAGYVHQAVRGQKAYHGVAILSKRPIREVERRDFSDIADSRHISALFEAGGRTIRLHNFYAPAGGDEPDPQINPKFAHKLRFLEAMASVHSEEGGTDSLLVGDLNIAPLENDVWSHRQMLKVVSHTPQEVELLTRVQHRGDWIDIGRRVVPEEEKLYTWWSYRARDWEASDRGRRLDHIWSSSSLAARLSRFEAMKEARGWPQPSDHAPVIAQFDLD